MVRELKQREENTKKNNNVERKDVGQQGNGRIDNGQRTKELSKKEGEKMKTKSDRDCSGKTFHQTCE